MDLEKLSQELADSGKLIEAGWIGLRIAAVPKDAPDIQLNEMRAAFFAGAAHLFSSIMTILDPGEEPTEKDLDRLSLIKSELYLFIADFQMKHIPTEGSA